MCIVCIGISKISVACAQLPLTIRKNIIIILSPIFFFLLSFLHSFSFIYLLREFLEFLSSSHAMCILSIWVRCYSTFWFRTPHLELVHTHIHTHTPKHIRTIAFPPLNTIRFCHIFNKIFFILNESAFRISPFCQRLSTMVHLL